MKQITRLALLKYGLFSLIPIGLLEACGAENQITPTTGPTPDSQAVVSLPGTGSANATTASATTGAAKAASTTSAATTAASTNAPVSTTAASATTATSATTAAAVEYPKPALTIPQQGATRPVPEFSGTGEVTERDFYSNILQKTEPYRIYLPADYHTSQKRYPVLYLLHGYSGQITEWMQYGIFDRYEELLAKHRQPIHYCAALRRTGILGRPSERRGGLGQVYGRGSGRPHRRQLPHHPAQRKSGDWRPLDGW